MDWLNAGHFTSKECRINIKIYKYSLKSEYSGNYFSTFAPDND